MPLNLSRAGRQCEVTVNSDNDTFLSRINISTGDDCRVEIGRITNINSVLNIHMADNCVLTIGDNFASNGNVNLNIHEPGLSIAIGRDCMFGMCSIWASDMHSVIDVATSHRINFGKSIQIADHVWIGHDALVLKGVSIGTGSIVGAKSVVTRSVPPNTCVAGHPARILMRGVTWDSRLLPPAPGTE